MSTQIVEAVAAASVDAMRAQRDASAADLVELRIDTLARPDVDAALAGRRRPVVVTCRAKWEGGFFEGPEPDRLALLTRALELGAEYVDLEWRAAAVLETWPAEVRPRVVLSHHDFGGVPADVADRVRDMRRHGTGIVKIAVTAARLRDTLPVIAIGRAGLAAGQRTVVIAMGMAGVVTRVVPAHVGSCWTYGGNGVAPGQVTVDRLREEFRIAEVDETTPVYAVVGRPIGHSVSPAMHNAAFKATGLDGVYVPCEAADFDDFLALADVLPIAGASVTAPFKEDAARLAGQPGALNTLRRRDGEVGRGWEGINTDVEGFLAPLAAVPLDGMRAAVVGAGGSARSVVAGLVSRGARVAIHARRPEAAAALAAAHGVEAGAWPVPGGSWDLLVNTTPVGTYPEVDRAPVDAAALDGALVYDLVYNPRPTRLLRDAAAAGCRTIDGLEMLVAQAVRQFTWWRGCTPYAPVLRDAADRRLAAMAAETAASTAGAGKPL